MVKDAVEELRQTFRECQGSRSILSLATEVRVNRLSLGVFASGGRVSTQTLERIEAWVAKQSHAAN